jgi:RNA recognition motif-containing protein
MSNNILYIGNFPDSVNENSIGELFSQVGRVESVMIIRDIYSGKSRMFGFVTMSNSKEAESAVMKLNGNIYWGSKLIVNPSNFKTNQEVGIRN